MFKFYVLVLLILALVYLSCCAEPIDIRVNDGIEAGIDIDTSPFTKIGNGYYFISENTFVNWYEAYEKCRLMGAELVAFETVEEWDAVIKIVTERNKRIGFWTSGTDLGKEGSYIWFKNGKPININKWAPRQPDNARNIEHCIHIGYIYPDSKVYQLNDCPCFKPNLINYICEAPEPRTISLGFWK